MKRVLLLLALVGCAVAEVDPARPPEPSSLSFSSREIGKRPFAHECLVTAIAFNSSGDRIATGAVDGAVRVFDLEGRLLEKHHRHESRVAKLAFLDDGLLVSQSKDGRVHLGTLDFEGLAGHTFSAGVSRVAFPERVDTVAIVDSMGLLDRVQHRSLEALALSRDGALLACSGGGVLAVYDWVTGHECFRSPSTQLSTARGLAFFTGRRLLVEHSNRFTLLDADASRALENLDGTQTVAEDDGGQSGVSWVVRDDVIASTSLGQKGRVTVDVRGTGFETAVSVPGEWSPVALSPGGRLLALGRACGVEVFDARSGRSLTCVAGHSAEVSALGFIESGCELVSVALDGRAHIWSVDSGTPVRSVEMEGRPLVGTISETGRAMVLTSEEKTRDVFAARELEAPRVVDCELSPRGGILATIGRGELAILDPESGAWMRKWVLENAEDHRVTFDAHGRRVAALLKHTGSGMLAPYNEWSTRWTLHVFDIGSGANWSPTLDDVRSVGPGPEGFQWLSWSQGVTTIGPRGVPLEGGWPNGVFSPHGDLVALWGRAAVPLYDTRTGKCVSVLRGHVREVTAIAFSADEKTIATGDASGAIRLWELRH